ncbi:MAG: prefoldin subunit [Candidatus Micrarchaeota archaeon]
MDEQNLVQAQKLQQRLQFIVMQKQQLQLQQSEIDRALKELEGASVAFRVAGSIMVEKKVPDLKNQLTEEKETVDVRLKALETQEASLIKEFEELRKKIEPAGGDTAVSS